MESAHRQRENAFPREMSFDDSDNSPYKNLNEAEMQELWEKALNGVLPSSLVDLIKPMAPPSKLD
jgi:hypothetical protein